VRYLILSDIHANWEALQAVLEDSRDAYDSIVCCGDIVGYGPDPNRVTDWVRQAASTASIRGNHDKACAGLDDISWFNPVAQTSALWTRRELSPDNLAFLRALPQGPADLGRFNVFHGSPIDEDAYLISQRDAADVAGYLDRALNFFGHTHIQGGFLCHRMGVVRIPRTSTRDTRQTLQFEEGVRYLINPGAVGQPRDGDPRAAYVLYEEGSDTLTYHRVVYDVASVQHRIRAAGLPDLLAQRLGVGS